MDKIEVVWLKSYEHYWEKSQETQWIQTVNTRWLSKRTPCLPMDENVNSNNAYTKVKFYPANH